MNLFNSYFIQHNHLYDVNFHVQSSIGTYGVFWMFGLICTVSVFFVFFIVPETRGKTLEEIENLFSPSTHVTPTSSLTKRPARRLSSRANLKATPSMLM